MGTRADEYEHSREALQLATISVDRRRRGSAPVRAEPLAHGHAVPPLRRAHRLLAVGALRSTQRREASRRQPRRHAAVGIARVRRRAARPGKPGDALFSVQEISPNVMVGIVTARDRTIHAGALVQIDARNTPTRPAWTPTQYASGGDRRPRLPQRRERALHRAHAERPDAAATRRRSAGTASRASCPTGASSSRGPTARSTT